MPRSSSAVSETARNLRSLLERLGDNGIEITHNSVGDPADTSPEPSPAGPAGADPLSSSVHELAQHSSSRSTPVLAANPKPKERVTRINRARKAILEAREMAKVADQHDVEQASSQTTPSRRGGVYITDDELSGVSRISSTRRVARRDGSGRMLDVDTITSPNSSEALAAQQEVIEECTPKQQADMSPHMLTAEIVRSESLDVSPTSSAQSPTTRLRIARLLARSGTSTMSGAAAGSGIGAIRSISSASPDSAAENATPVLSGDSRIGLSSVTPIDAVQGLSLRFNLHPIDADSKPPSMDQKAPARRAHTDSTEGLGSSGAVSRRRARLNAARKAKKSSQSAKALLPSIGERIIESELSTEPKPDLKVTEQDGAPKDISAQHLAQSAELPPITLQISNQPASLEPKTEPSRVLLSALSLHETLAQLHSEHPLSSESQNDENHPYQAAPIHKSDGEEEETAHPNTPLDTDEVKSHRETAATMDGMKSSMQDLSGITFHTSDSHPLPDTMQAGQPECDDSGVRHNHTATTSHLGDTGDDMAFLDRFAQSLSRARKAREEESFEDAIETKLDDESGINTQDNSPKLLGMAPPTSAHDPSASSLSATNSQQRR